MRTACPACGASIELPFNQYATTFHRRTCRKCRAVWRIKITPIARKKIIVSHVTFEKHPKGSLPKTVGVVEEVKDHEMASR